MGWGVGVHNIYFFIWYLGRKGWGGYLFRKEVWSLQPSLYG